MSNKKNDRRPWALNWRSNTLFIVATVAVGLFTDLFLYGLVVPLLPFVLRSRLEVPDAETLSPGDPERDVSNQPSMARYGTGETSYILRRMMNMPTP